MANGITQRGNLWWANWKANGSLMRISTKIKVSGNKWLTPRRAEKAAQSVAEVWKNVYRGAIAIKDGIGALTAIPDLTPAIQQYAIDKARELAAQGGFAGMPTCRDYLTAFNGGASESAENERKRAFRYFLCTLGNRGDLRLDRITPTMAREHIRGALELRAAGTVKLERDYLSAAFNRAIKDKILDAGGNPFEHVTVAKESVSVNPELGKDRQKRDCFTPQEIHIIVTQFVRPWRDLALLAIITGQRLGDICTMKWDDLDLDAGTWNFTIRKVRDEHSNILPDELISRLYTIRDEQKDAPASPYVFPLMAARYLNKSTRAGLSTEFTSMVKAAGMVNLDTLAAKRKGNRRTICPKSFHSLRHNVVSFIRSDARFTGSLACAYVGQSDAIQMKNYFDASRDKKREAANALMDFCLNPPTIENNAG
ncbi:MAG: tyrosine-type recombinase/integrase [Akkermansia sp.]|nr:tyrosine-type recombinase/integrase [Akkermansia sp.]